MRRLTSIDASSTSKPATVAVPDVGGRKQVSMRMVVVLPAPFGPRKPTICPFRTSKEMWSTAVWRAYLLVRSVTVIIKFSFCTSDVQVLNCSNHNELSFGIHYVKNRPCSCQIGAREYVASSHTN